MITIVSGLPRSGTSLMMQILHAGGVSVLTDERRQPDADNPRGYFEFEPVKRLATDQSWIAAAEGKVVKIVSPLLFDLPAGHEYRVIFMTRDLDEILASQQAMLARRGAGHGPDDAQMRAHFERHLAKVRALLAPVGQLPTFWCHYSELVASAATILPQLAAFLGGNLDQQRMLAAVDPALYRQRRETRRGSPG